MLAAVMQSWDTSFVQFVKVAAVVYVVCSPDDGHNDARNMLS